jgi:PhzF family phenazine biosynthesis protein
MRAMHTKLFQVDAFASRRFEGNPAAVMPLPHFLDDESLQSIAAENNLSETAFLVPHEGNFRLRWFTPRLEVPLCGHATLASAAVVMERLEPSRRSVTFRTASGALIVARTQRGYKMNFPSRPSAPSQCAGLEEALGARPGEVFANPFNWLALLESEEAVRSLQPDFAAIKKLGLGGVIATARGRDYDFVSRYFAPAKGIDEDPVTGAAHCMLAPFWAQRLGKNEFRAYQASSRGGEMGVALKGDRVELEGSCVFYLEGEAEI